MINALTKTFLCPLGGLLAFSFIATMFVCGDIDCLAGEGDGGCASLFCSLLNKHDAASQSAARAADRDCSCVCHVPTVIGPVFGFSYSPIAQYNTAAIVLQIPSAPRRPVYHPPSLV